MKQKKNNKKQFFLHGVGRMALSKVLSLCSLVTILILLMTIFFTLPKLIIISFVVILIFQPFLLIFFNDHSKCK